MATNLNSGFTNNINTIQIRTSGSSSQRVTDRAIDTDGDGNKQAVTITPGTPAGGNKLNPPSLANGGILHDLEGIARSVIKTDVETDGGVDVTGSEYTEGGN